MIDDGPWAAVPGETPIDISGIKIPSVRNRGQLNIVEAKNIAKAVHKYLAGRINQRVAPFTFEWTLRLHKQMFSDVWRWAGIVRTFETNIGSQAHLIREHLAHLLSDLKSWTEFQMPMDEQAARLHHRAVQIHPFENGNGRWARLLANVWLHRAGETYVEWPESAISEQHEVRREYLSAVRLADNGDYTPLITLQRRYTIPK